MHQPVTVQVAGGIAILTVDNPPANALEVEVIDQLERAVDAVTANDEVNAVVIAARGRTFPSAIEDYTGDWVGATKALSQLCQKIEGSQKPVVAAMQGNVDQLGMELALAAHYRIADRRATFALSGIRMGLPTGAGGTQRLPRLIGVRAAMEMLLSGSSLAAKDAADADLIDAVATGPLPVFSINWVKSSLADDLKPRPTRSIRATLEPAKAHLGQIQRTRQGLPATALTAHHALLDCLEAAVILPFEAALSKEAAIYEDCVASSESRALRHVIGAEERASIPPVDASVAPVKCRKIGIVGGGRIGRGIVVAALEAGIDVTLVEQEISQLEEAVEGIIDLIDQEIHQKRLLESDRDRMLGLLSGKVELGAVTGADLVIDATPENDSAKRRVFSALDAVMQRGAILATTSSFSDLDVLAAATGRSDSVVGLHFFPPAHRLKTVEVVLGVGTSDPTVSSAFAFAKSLGKVPVATVTGPGFIAYRMFSSMLDAALFAYVQGNPIQEIDRAMEAYGFPLGPFRLADALGLDHAEQLQKKHSSASGLRVREVLSRLVADERLGRKSGRGFYLHGKGGTPSDPDPEIETLMEGLVVPKARMEDGHIRRACLSALVNQGAGILEEGIGQRPSDIDVLMLQVFGYPRPRGGPMMDADLTGLLKIRKDLDRLSGEFPEIWKPQPMFDELIKNGETFGSLNT